VKRLGNLYDNICSLENLRLADEKARKGKLRSRGVVRHDRNREQNLLALHERLKNGAFRTSKYEIFTIHEPKEREIYRLPYYPDRIVHHAVMNILEPVWVSIFTADTYSCIKKRGIHAAAKKVKEALREYPEATKYCLKTDIRKFYPSIDHDILKQIGEK
jgi:retron-type reverse transcriptase